jgi:hypothetical protein
LFPSFAREVADRVLPWHPIPTPLADGSLASEALEKELADIVVGLAAGRVGDGEITVFLSPGRANWDVAVAVRTEARARRLGVCASTGLSKPSVRSTALCRRYRRECDDQPGRDHSTQGRPPAARAR